jgi:hypothetical protein
LCATTASPKKKGSPALSSAPAAGRLSGRTPKWATLIAREAGFADRFAAQELERYLGIILTTGRGLFDRDTAPGAEPEEIMGIKAPALIIPGDDPSHATSGAHYLRELLPKADFWNVMPPDQSTQKVCDHILNFSRK